MAVAPGKLLLFGEHSALYGFPALGLPLKEGITVTLEPGGQGLSFPGLPEKYRPLAKELFITLKGNKKGEGMQVHIESTLPLGAGFGSSGALCVAAVKALYPSLLSGKDDQEIWIRAHKGEQIFHHKSSGIDTGLSVYNTPLAFRFTSKELPEIQPIAPPPGFFLYSAVERLGTTHSLVRDLAQKTQSTGNQEMKSIQELGHITSSLFQGSNYQDVQFWADSIIRAQGLLQNLGLSHPVLDLFFPQAMEQGASGAKISGAGGGGAFFLYYKTKELAEKGRSYMIHWFKDHKKELLTDPTII